MYYLYLQVSSCNGSMMSHRRIIDHVTRTHVRERGVSRHVGACSSCSSLTDLRAVLLRTVTDRVRASRRAIASLHARRRWKDTRRPVPSRCVLR